MIRRRIAVLCAAGLAVLPAVSGCTRAGSPAVAASAAPTVSTEPVAMPEGPDQLLAQLRGTLTTLRQKNYAFTLTAPGMTVKGVVCQQTVQVEKVYKSHDETDTVDLLAVGPDRWMRIKSQSKQFEKNRSSRNLLVRSMTVFFAGKFWFKFDPEKLHSAAFNLDTTDVSGVAGLIQHSGPGMGNALSMTGSLGADRLGDHYGVLDPGEIRSMGLRAGAMPYTATLDRQGRLVEFADEVPKTDDEPDGRWDFTFTGYGAQQPQTPPPAPAVNLPPGMYKYLNKS